MISHYLLSCSAKERPFQTKIDNLSIGIKSQPSPASTKGSEHSADSAVPEEPQPSSGVGGEHSTMPEGAGSKRASVSVSGVLMQLEQLIVSDEWTRKEQSDVSAAPHGNAGKRKRADGPRLTELGRSLVTSYSLKAYIDLLGVNHRQSIASWLYGNTSSALAGLFRFSNALVHCEDSDSAAVHSVRNGIGHAVRLALRHVYGPDLVTNGWRTFVEQGAPVVYVSPGLHMDLAPYLANEFSIADCVTVAKAETPLADVEGRLNPADLEERLALDFDPSSNRKPLLVVAVVGSAIFGQNDLVSRLIELRAKYGFWLHVVGQGLAALALKEPTETLVKVLTQADSFTLPLAQWLGVPAAPVVTLHRPLEDYKPTYREKLDSLPWWVATQHLTLKRMTDTIETAYYLSKLMLKGLSNFPRIELFGIPNAADFAMKVYKGSFSAPTVLIFKYNYYDTAVVRRNSGGSNAEAIITDSPIVSAEDVEYADSLNSWLGQGLISECRALGLHLIELGGQHGTAFRFCPLESAAAAGTKPEDVQKFIKQLGETLSIVDATVRARRRLPDILAGHPTLCRLPIQKWAGVGAVCYVPSIVKDTVAEEWNEKQRQQVSYLNLELVHSLRATDSAFSSGDSAIDVSCVKFGMLADEKDLDDLIAMVAERGKAIEDSAQYMEHLAQLIRQGIEAANEDLRKENDERLMQEGVIRQLPIMGSLVNWFSPMGKETTNIKGRSFDLKTGQ
uniref:Pyridoxal-dependent decarboxylase domain-containing protein 1 n=1 Tax=Plectus sambesii TaxID=2011161 RepID=A0A914X5C4_9BILA